MKKRKTSNVNQSFLFALTLYAFFTISTIMFVYEGRHYFKKIESDEDNIRAIIGFFVCIFGITLSIIEFILITLFISV